LFPKLLIESDAPMKETLAQQLRETIQLAVPRLRSISDSRAAGKPYPDKWSIKEILGHLVDSAGNNHQRIVRMQEAENIGVFGYSQQHWVNSQNYQAEPWQNVVEFWHSYNNHLTHVIEQIDPGSLEHLCDVGYSEPATLEFILEDYLRHVEHHLKQIFSESDPGKREKWVRRDPGKTQ
jgi:hypothetical protein